MTDSEQQPTVKTEMGEAETQPAATVKTPLGFEVAAHPGQEYREHTAERWRERDPLSFEFCLYLIKDLGITVQTTLTDLIDDHRKARNLPGISRNCVIALFQPKSGIFKPGEIDEIIRTRSALLTAQALAKIEILLDDAKKAKDLGAAAMALTALFNVKQISHGAATRITGKSEDADKARSYDFYRARAQAKLEEQRRAAALAEKREAAIEVEVIAENITDAAQRVPTTEQP